MRCQPLVDSLECNVGDVLRLDLVDDRRQPLWRLRIHGALARMARTQPVRHSLDADDVAVAVATVSSRQGHRRLDISVHGCKVNAEHLTPAGDAVLTDAIDVLSANAKHPRTLAHRLN